MSSPTFEEVFEDSPTINNTESGYASGASSTDALPEVYFSKPHLKFLNSQLQKLEPEGMISLHVSKSLAHTNTFQTSFVGASHHCLDSFKQQPSA